MLIYKKRTCHLVNFAVLRKMKESEKIDKYFDFTKELKSLWNMKVIMIPIVVSVIKTIPKGLENQRQNQDHPDYSIVKMSWNTQKSSGDLLSL